MIPFGLLLIVNIYRKDYSLGFFRENLKWELLFLLAFLFMIEIRFVSPTISFAEKFMDHAFLASIIREPVIPPLDPWFAGNSECILYLGYWFWLPEMSRSPHIFPSTWRSRQYSDLQPNMLHWESVLIASVILLSPCTVIPVYLQSFGEKLSRQSSGIVQERYPTRLTNTIFFSSGGCHACCRILTSFFCSSLVLRL
jgi:hypothetical protein